MKAKDILFRSIAAGLIAALAISLPDAFFSSVSPSFAGWAAHAAVLAPLGALWGLCAGIFTAARGPKPSFRSIALRPDLPAVSLRTFLMGLLLIAGFKVLFAADFFFATSFHHPGLAAFALLLFLIIGGAVTAVVLPYFLRFAEAKLLRIERLRQIMPRPLIAACFPAGVFFGFLLPAVHRGSGAAGPFGFLGMLREAGGAAIVSGLILIVTTMILTSVFAIHLKRLVTAVFIAAVLTALAGMIAAPAMVQRSPKAQASLTQGPGAAAWTYRFALRLTKPKTAHNAASVEDDVSRN